jgi:hypothetical protein
MIIPGSRLIPNLPGTEYDAKVVADGKTEIWMLGQYLTTITTPPQFLALYQEEQEKKG